MNEEMNFEAESAELAAPLLAESASHYEDEGESDGDNFDRRLRSLYPGFPCCGEGGACTGGSQCYADEPDNIPEDY